MIDWPQEKLKTMLMQNFGVTNKERYGMLRYFLEWSISFVAYNNYYNKFCFFWICSWTVIK